MPEPDSRIRIAMWSGPRNISTALLRAWGSRDDTVVVDEPLYAFYLDRTGFDHPGRDEVLRSQPVDWREVARQLTGAIPGRRRISYQKHMAHHLLPEIDRDWLDALTHAFLIRDPREMLTSLVRVTPDPGLDDTGLPQQWELFQRTAERLGEAPPVIDARDVLENPRDMLSGLCAALGVPFQEAMLSWAPGRRPTDGVWAPHWYAAVERSTGFHPYRPKPDPVPERLMEVHASAVEIYDRLRPYRLAAGASKSP